MNVEHMWIATGLAGQLMFTARFIVQWLASERAGRSLVPTMFWYLSIAGSSILLGYAVYRADPVFILGQSFGLFVYLRNLCLIRRSGESALAGG